MTSSISKHCVILSSIFLASSLLPIGTVLQARAADKPNPHPDVLVFSNGEKLSGKLDHEADGNLFFNSENAGTVKVPWDKLQSLQTATPFAVIETGVKVGRKKPNRDIPLGTITVEGSTLTVNTADGPRQMPVKSVAYLVDEPTFEKNVRNGQRLTRELLARSAPGPVP